MNYSSGTNVVNRVSLCGTAFIREEDQGPTSVVTSRVREGKEIDSTLDHPK